MNKPKYIIMSAGIETASNDGYASTTNLKDALKTFTKLKKKARQDVKDEFDTLKGYHNQRHPKVEGIDIVLLKVIFDEDGDEVDYIIIKRETVEERE